MRSRAELLLLWLQLTRVTLPAMAQTYGWSIRQDHCFMRVCLDDALQAKWDTVVQRPAIHHLTNIQLEEAVSSAERIVNDPALLVVLNEASLRRRREIGKGLL